MSTCFVPGCHSGYTSQRNAFKISGEQVPSLFGCKKNDKLMLKKWSLAIRRADRPFTFQDKVCELHFTEDDIDDKWVTQMPDGYVFQLEKQRPTLKYGAIPSIFPNRPRPVIKKARKRTATNDTMEPKKKKCANAVELCENENAILTTCSNLGNYSPRSTPVLKEHRNNFKEDTACVTDISASDSLAFTMCDEDEQRTEFSYSELVRNLRKIEKPDTWWGISCHHEFIVCVKWNMDFTVEKKLVIDQNLNIKVFLKNREINFMDEKLSCIERISAILRKIDSYEICDGVDDKKVTNCQVVLLLDPFSPGPKRTLCYNCLGHRRKEAFKLWNRSVICTDPSTRRRQCLADSRLKQKVALLQRRFNIEKKRCKVELQNS